ncbi:MAG: RNase III [Candidatus Westeberhardia cardiocondylae]|nr:RNase III [Candidatus Westeberhardia cardiocondylae]
MNFKFLDKLQKKIGYFFEEKNFLFLSLTHRSASNLHNERLEFLGDSILNYVIANVLYKRFPSIDEGEMSRMRSILVCRNTLVEIAKRFKLGSYIFLGIGEIRNGGTRRESILANTIEALIGAIFLDSDIKIIERLVIKWYSEHLLEIIPGKNQKDPKTRLQEYLQGNHLPLPVYILMDTKGEKHDQKFFIQCHVTGIKTIIIGSASSRRKAEQIAAEKIINILKIK